MIVSDALEVLGVTVRNNIPVTIYLTSMAEPEGKCWIEMSNSQPNLPVRIKAPGLFEGETGFAILHTSAGLRAYTLGPLSSLPLEAPFMQGLIDDLCDTFHVPLSPFDGIEIQELKWLEPPPGYTWGHEPLRQWQIVMQGLPEDGEIEVHANAGEGPLLATRSDFVLSESRAMLEIVTDAETDLVLRALNANQDTTVTFTTRWLLPQHREVFDAPVQAFSKTASILTLHTEAGERNFDLGQWQSGTTPRSLEGRTRIIDRQGQSLSLKSNRVVLIHEGDLVIATPLNTLTREDV